VDNKTKLQQISKTKKSDQLPVTLWKTGPKNPNFPPETLHIWNIAFPVAPSVQQCLQDILSIEERLRAEQFYFAADKARFIVGRSALRHIIAAYLNIPAREIQFNYAQNGKPELTPPRLHFNLSHAHQCILIAISPDSPVGIDVEYFKHDLDFLAIADEFCSKAEYEKLLTTPDEEKYLAFFRCWTRKEAIIKAQGQGLSFPLKQLEVSFLPQEKVEILSFEDNPSFHSWKLEELNPRENYIAAIATPKPYKRIFFWHWDQLAP